MRKIWEESRESWAHLQDLHLDSGGVCADVDVMAVGVGVGRGVDRDCCGGGGDVLGGGGGIKGRTGKRRQNLGRAAPSIRIVGLRTRCIEPWRRQRDRGQRTSG
jgi:hypothetical protein